METNYAVVRVAVVPINVAWTRIAEVLFNGCKEYDGSHSLWAKATGKLAVMNG